jgi:hypothetical protein
MEEEMDDDETLIINGLHIDKHLLDVQPIRRCDIVSCRGLCCSHGVRLDVGERANILRHAQIVKPCLPAERRDEQLWFRGYEVTDRDFPSGKCDAANTVTDPDRLLGQACVFLLPDARCALQVAATANGMHRWALKPFFCALYPLVLDEGWLELDDENELYQEDACRRRTMCVQEPLYMAMKDEFMRALGAEGYLQLSHCARARDPCHRRGTTP